MKKIFESLGFLHIFALLFFKSELFINQQLIKTNYNARNKTD